MNYSLWKYINLQQRAGKTLMKNEHTGKVHKKSNMHTKKSATLRLNTNNILIKGYYKIKHEQHIDKRIDDSTFSDLEITLELFQTVIFLRYTSFFRDIQTLPSWHPLALGPISWDWGTDHPYVDGPVLAATEMPQSPCDWHWD